MLFVDLENIIKCSRRKASFESVLTLCSFAKAMSFCTQARLVRHMVLVETLRFREVRVNLWWELNLTDPGIHV